MHSKGQKYLFECAAPFCFEFCGGRSRPGKDEILMVDEKLTAHLAELSKLEFTDAELAEMTKDMTDIIGLMDKVCGFDSNVKPYTLDPVDYSELREDTHNDSYPTEEILGNAKNVKSNSFVVPKVV